MKSQPAAQSMRLFQARLTDSREILPGQWLQAYDAQWLAAGARAGQFVHVRTSDYSGLVLRRRPVEEVVRLEDTVERERLRLETRGDLETTQPIDAEQAEEAEWTRPIRRRSEDA